MRKQNSGKLILSRPDPCSENFGHKTSKFWFELCRRFLVGFSCFFPRKTARKKIHSPKNTKVTRDFVRINSTRISAESFARYCSTRTCGNYSSHVSMTLKDDLSQLISVRERKRQDTCRGIAFTMVCMATAWVPRTLCLHSPFQGRAWLWPGEVGIVDGDNPLKRKGKEVGTEGRGMCMRSVTGRRILGAGVLLLLISFGRAEELSGTITVASKMTRDRHSSEGN